MKRLLVLLFLFLACQETMHGQKIQYSRQTVRSLTVDAMQLVANVRGNHHLLCFTANKKPKVYVFNRLLQLVSERELEIKVAQATDVRIVNFTGYYYLYLHFPEKKSRSFFKINSDGEAEDMTTTLLNALDSAGIHKTANFQLLNHHNELFLLTHSYFAAAKQINSKIVKLDGKMDSTNITLASFPFDATHETLQQSMLAGDGLLVLKTVRNENNGNSLEVVKFDLNSGDVLSNVFYSASHMYSSPGFKYNEKDSSLLIYSTLREPLAAARQQRIVFISRLNDSLQQVTPISLLKTQFRNNAGTNFLFLDGVQPHWLSFSHDFRIRTAVSRTNEVGINASGSGFPAVPNRGYSPYVLNYSQPTAVRLTVLNEKLSTTKDTLVENNNSFFDLQPRPSAQFTMNNEAYLVLIQNFSNKKRGLVMLNADKRGELVTTPLPVYDRYEYNIGLLQPGNDYFILPYTHKSETGLLKITLSN